MSAPSKPKVLLVDDDLSVLEALGYLISRHSTLVLAGVAPDSESALNQVRRLKPDLVLIDINLRGKSGIEATRDIRLLDPHVKILAHSAYPEMADQIIAAGASGFVAKGRATEELIAAMNLVIGGGIYFDADTWALLNYRFQFNLNPKIQLDEEEQSVAPYIMRGLTSKEIAEKLLKTRRRIEKVRKRIMKKVHARNAAELAATLALASCRF